MWDKKRKLASNGKPDICGIIAHHSAGNRYTGCSAEYVFEEFNTVGYNRGYKPYGYNFATGISEKWGQCMHTHDGRISYCEYHYAIYETAPGEYGLVSLIDNPEWTDAGSIGRQRSDETDEQRKARARLWNPVAVAIVFAGNFEAENIPESMIEYFIKLFRKGGPLAWIKEQYSLSWIKGHRDTWDETACPGKYLYTYLPRIEREVSAI